MPLRLLALLLVLVAPSAWAGPNSGSGSGGGGGGGLPTRTVAQMTSLCSAAGDIVYVVNDCTAVNDCSTGGGTARELATCTGANTFAIVGDGTAAPGVVSYDAVTAGTLLSVTHTVGAGSALVKTAASNAVIEATAVNQDGDANDEVAADGSTIDFDIDDDGTPDLTMTTRGLTELVSHDLGDSNDACVTLEVVDAGDLELVACTSYNGAPLTDGYFTAQRTGCGVTLNGNTECKYGNVEFWFEDYLGSAGTAGADDQGDELTAFHVEAVAIIAAMDADRGATNQTPDRMTVHLPAGVIFVQPDNGIRLIEGTHTPSGNYPLTWVGHGTDIKMSNTDDNPDDLPNAIRTAAEADCTGDLTVAQNDHDVACTAGTFDDVVVGDILCTGAGPHTAGADDCYSVTWVEEGSGDNLLTLARPYQSADTTITDWRVYQAFMLDASINDFEMAGNIRFIDTTGTGSRPWSGYCQGVSCATLEVNFGSTVAASADRDNPWSRIRLKGARIVVPETVSFYLDSSHPHDVGIFLGSKDGGAGPRHSNGTTFRGDVRGPLATYIGGTTTETAFYDEALAGNGGRILIGTNHIRLEPQFIQHDAGRAIEVGSFTGWHNIDLNGNGCASTIQCMRTHGLRWMTVKDPSHELGLSSHPTTQPVFQFNTGYSMVLPPDGPAAADAIDTNHGYLRMTFSKLSTSSGSDRSSYFDLNNHADNVWHIHTEGKFRYGDQVFDLATDDADITFTGDIAMQQLDGATAWGATVPTTAVIAMNVDGKPLRTKGATFYDAGGTNDFCLDADDTAGLYRDDDCNGTKATTEPVLGGLLDVASVLSTALSTDTSTRDANSLLVFVDDETDLPAAGTTEVLQIDENGQVTAAGYAAAPLKREASPNTILYPADGNFADDFAWALTGADLQDTAGFFIDTSAHQLILGLDGADWSIDVRPHATTGQCNTLKEKASGEGDSVSWCLNDGNINGVITYDSDVNGRFDASDVITAGTIDTTEIAAGGIDGTDLAADLTLLTTGTIRGKVSIITTTDGSETVSSNQMHGSFFRADHATATSDTTYTIPDLDGTGFTGYSACFYDDGEGTGGIILDPTDPEDIFVLDGTPAAANEAIHSPGVAGDGANGDFICIIGVAQAGTDGIRWLTLGRSGTWVEETP